MRKKKKWWILQGKLACGAGVMAKMKTMDMKALAALDREVHGTLRS